jgi:hypothetical protein
LRHFIISICSTITLSLFSGAALAQAELFVTPANATVVAGDEFEVRIEVDADFLALMGYDVVLAFDSSLVTVLSVDEGPLPPTGPDGSYFYWFNPGLPDSTVHVNGAVLGTAVDGPGILFTVTFEALEVGTTPMNIVHHDIRDDTNTPILHDVLNTTVIIEKPIPAESSTWGRVKALYQN